MSSQTATDIALPLEDSFRKRYLFKLSSNLLGFALGFVTMGIVPRTLGPVSYGKYSFLISFFQQMVGALDSGASQALYAKISHAPAEKAPIAFFRLIAAVVVLVTAAVIAVIWVSGFEETVWPGQNMLYVVAAAGVALGGWMVNTVFVRFTDAHGLTVSGEKIGMAQKVAGTVLIISLFYNGALNLDGYFAYQYFILGFSALLLVKMLHAGGIQLFERYKFAPGEFKAQLRYYYDYCHPLITYSIIGMVVGIADTWLLQLFGGSVEQAFFGLSSRLGDICFLFTSAMTGLLLREFAKSHGKNDMEEMRRLFERHIPMLYMVAAFFSLYVIAQSERVVHLIGGREYQGASVALAVMLMYPIHRTYGQLSGSLFFATGRTSDYRNIGVVMMLAGLPVTFILLAPAEYFGLNLGAIGLALKCVVSQIIAVNLQIWYNIKFLKIGYGWFLFHQIIVVALFGAIGVVSAAAGSAMASGDLASFTLGGLVYTAMSAIFIYTFPSIAGMTKSDFKDIYGLVAGKLGPTPAKIK